MKNNCQFITAKFNRYDRFLDSGKICCRIITNKEVYFFYRNQFIDVKVLDELKKDDVIHIGSHELDYANFGIFRTDICLAKYRYYIINFEWYSVFNDSMVHLSKFI